MNYQNRSIKILFHITLYKKIRYYAFVWLLFHFFYTHAHAETKVTAPQFPRKVYSDAFSLQWLPASPFSTVIEERVIERNPNMGNELTYTFTIEKKYLENKSNEDIDLLILQVLLRVSSQKNITYYSNSRKEYRLFIEDIYRITSVEDTSPLRDMRSSSLRQSIHSIIFKHDSSFGKGAFSYTIAYQDSHDFLISIENLENVFYNHFILVATPRTLVSDILIQRRGNTFIIYSTSHSNIDMPFMSLRKRAATSLLYRMFSLVQWFKWEFTQEIERELES